MAVALAFAALIAIIAFAIFLMWNPPRRRDRIGGFDAGDSGYGPDGTHHSGDGSHH
jgi:hypothetical protein